MSKETKSLFSELFDAIVFCLDSKAKKFSLDTYLDIIGKYTDKLIVGEEKNGNSFVSGKCRAELENDGIMFTVCMFFVDQNNMSYEKKASRKLPKTRFTHETIAILKNGPAEFDIDKPRREKY